MLVPTGDVYLCGGQRCVGSPSPCKPEHSYKSNRLLRGCWCGDSNMQFSIGLGGNASAEAQRADSYPTIRLTTVAHSSKWSFDQVGAHGHYRYPLRDLLHEPFQPWSVASNISLISTQDKWGYFSSVCWFFGRRIHDGLGGKVPIGLISNNW